MVCPKPGAFDNMTIEENTQQLSAQAKHTNKMNKYNMKTEIQHCISSIHSQLLQTCA